MSTIFNISDPTPEFSALYNDPNTGDLAPYYRMQVSTSSLGNWADSYWDSGTSTMATTTEGSRNPELSYTGSALASSTVYYWRIKFSDDDRKTGDWSTATSTFSLNQTETGGTAPNDCGCATTTINYIHTDHLSGSNAITNDNDEVVQTLDYYPYGALRVDKQEADFNEKRKYTGHEYDDSTGLSYMGARYQTGTEGRFISQDPAHIFVGDQKFRERYNRELETHLVNPQLLNSYSYAGNNPLRYVDPKGEILWLVPIALAAYNVAMLGIDAYEIKTVLTYPEQFSNREKEEIFVKAGFDLVTSGFGSLKAFSPNTVYRSIYDVIGISLDVWSLFKGTEQNQSTQINSNPYSSSSQNVSSGPSGGFYSSNSGYNYSSQELQFLQIQHNRYQAAFGDEAASQKIESDAESLRSGKTAPVY